MYCSSIFISWSLSCIILLTIETNNQEKPNLVLFENRDSYKKDSLYKTNNMKKNKLSFDYPSTSKKCILIFSLFFALFFQNTLAQNVKAEFTLITKTNTPAEDSIYIIFSNMLGGVKMNKVAPNKWQTSLNIWGSCQYKYNRCEINGMDEEWQNRDRGFRDLTVNPGQTSISVTDTVYKWRWWPADGVLPAIDSSSYLKQPPSTLPSSDFHCGIALPDWWWKEFYPLIPSTLDRVIRNTNADWVEIIPTFTFKQISPMPIIGAKDFISIPDSSLNYVISECHKRNLKVLMLINLWGDVPDTLVGSHSKEWWLSYGKQYNSLMCHYAEICQKHNVEALCLNNGWQLWQIIPQQIPLVDSIGIWIIEDMKSKYKGLIGVEASSQYPNMKVHGKADFLTAGMWQNLQIGSDVPQPSVDQILNYKGWSGIQNQLDNPLKVTAEKWNKKLVILSHVISSYYDALRGNPYWETQFYWNPEDKNIPYDFQVQANAYEASMRAITAKNFMGGVYSFNYNLWNSVDKTPSIRTKPAENVLAKWYKWIRNQSPEKPGLKLNVNALNFGSVKLNTSKADSITISNSSWPILLVDSIYTNTTAFKPNKNKLELRGIDYIGIVFKPETFGSYTDTLYLKNNSALSLIKIPLTGVTDNTSTGINELIRSFEYEVFPNPLNDYTTFIFKTDEELYVGIEIYNSIGMKIDQIKNQRITSGNIQLVWRNSLPSGLYYCILRVYKTTDSSQTFIKLVKLIIDK